MAGPSNGQTKTVRLWAALARKKPLDGRTGTSLNRCLNLIDLTALGVGSTLGLGLYVLAGQVASKKAGPAVVVSFALAALASAFSALCYAEFAGRVPRAGSAYAYSYITVGEFVAFVIGWNLILEYVIGASSVARGFSSYLRIVYEHLLVDQSEPAAATSPTNLTALASSAPTNNPILSHLELYFDWPSLVVIFVVTVFILLGVKGSTHVTLAFTSVNLLVVALVVCSSLTSLNWHNWRLAKGEVPVGFGEGGFAPYGFAGILAGSSTCFFGFIGFDTIASSAEEAKEPKRQVPLAILLSLFISFVAYMLVATVQTLLWPYYDQNMDTILPYIFQRLHMPLAHWVVLLGAVAGLASSQLSGMYPLPRILYSMANDRLIYRPLAHINRRLKLPLRATIVGSLLVGLLSCLFDLEDLADMVSIGTLAAYTLVSLSVLILRYENRTLPTRLQLEVLKAAENTGMGLKLTSSVAPQAWLTTSANVIGSSSQRRQTGSFLRLLIAAKTSESLPSDATDRHSKVLIGLILVASVALNLAAKALIASPQSLLLSSIGALAALALALAMIMLNKLPTSEETQKDDMFRVPLVPLIPTLSILVNICLMLNLNARTWLRFIVWMVVGLFIYLTYGIWNSRGYLMEEAEEEEQQQQQQQDLEKE